MIREWNEKGYETVKDKENKGGRPPKLSDEELLALKRYLKEKESWKTKEVRGLINERFDVDLSEDQVARILKQKLRANFSVNPDNGADDKHSDFNDNANDSIIINDLDDIVTSWSPGAEKMFGWTAVEAIGKKAAELIVPTEFSHEMDLITSTALAGRSIRGIDTVLMRSDRNRMNVSMAVFPLRDTRQNIIGLSYIIRDNTGHKRAEEVLLREHDKLNTWVQELTSELSSVSKTLRAEITGHEHAKETVKTTLRFWQDTFNAISDGVWILDREGHIILSNRVYERLLGRDEKDVTGLHCHKIAHCVSDFIEKCPFKRMLNTGTHEHEEYEDKERGLWFQITVDPIRDRSGAIISAVHIASDITERKRYEETLLRMQEELEIRVNERTTELARANQALQAQIAERLQIEEALRESGKDIRNQQQHTEKLAGLLKKERDILNIIMENTETQLAYLDSKFNFIRVNSAYARGSGFTKNGLSGRNHFQLFPNAENQAIFEQVIETGKPVEFKAKPFEFADQPWRGTTYLDLTLTPVKDSEGRVDRLVLSLADVTERIRNEQVIEKALAYAESIVDTVPEPLLILDMHLRVKTANHAFYRTFKVSIEDTRDKSLYELGDRQWDIPELRNLMEDIIPRNNSVLDFEVEHEFPGIGQKTMLLNARRFYQEGTQMILLSIEDITDRKKIEEMRLERESLIFANKARSEFLAIMGHELRTPLTSVIGYSIILKEMAHGKLNDKQQLYMENILKSSEHLLSLINSILDLAKIEAGKLEMMIEDVRVPDTIDETINLMKEKAAIRNIILEREFDPALEVIKADGQKLRQILFNLLSNAVKFSKDNGGIITIRTRKEDGFAKFSVSDRGIGIREEDVPRLFHKFEQLDSGTSRKYEGTGLGLAITKQLVELHGGKIRVESRYGEGSTFTFTLPMMGSGKSS